MSMNYASDSTAHCILTGSGLHCRSESQNGNSRQPEKRMEGGLMTARTKAIAFAAALGGLAVLTFSLAHFALGKEARDDNRQHAHRKGIHKIKHIVFIVKENRTFDNYFGTFPGADGATSGSISTGEVVPLGHAPDVTSPKHPSRRYFWTQANAVKGPQRRSRSLR